jgi:serine/threonine protein kinase
MQRSGHVLECGLLVSQRYRVERLLGRGGMGEVYLATDTLLSEDLGASYVALKVLRADLSEDESYRKRFLREVAVTRSITHPNVVRTFDVGHTDGLLYFTMEYVEGETLDKRLAHEPLDYARAAAVLAQAAQGLSAIHAAGVVHRDLKPSNLIMNAAGEVKITDFGVARSANSSLTTTHEVIGSLYYLPPEAWKGEDITAQSDVYSLGVVAYELLTGVVPFDGAAAPEIMFKHLEVAPVAPVLFAEAVPGWMSELVISMLEKTPEDRPDTEHILRRLEGRSSSVEICLDEPREDPLQHRIEGCAWEEFLEERGELAVHSLSQRVPSFVDQRGNVPMVEQPRRRGSSHQAILSGCARAALAAATVLVIAAGVVGLASSISPLQVAAISAKGGAPLVALLLAWAAWYCWILVSPVFVIVTAVQDFATGVMAWLQAGMKFFLVALLLYAVLGVATMRQVREEGVVIPARIVATQAFEMSAQRLVQIGLLNPKVPTSSLASSKLTTIPVELRNPRLPADVLDLIALGLFLPTLAWGFIASLRPFASVWPKLAGALGLGVAPIVAGVGLVHYLLTPAQLGKVQEIALAVGPLTHTIHPWVLCWVAGYWALCGVVALCLSRK